MTLVIALVTILCCLISFSQSINEMPKISDNGYQIVNGDASGDNESWQEGKIENVHDSQDNISYDVAESNMKSGITARNYIRPSDTTNEENPQTELPPPIPDGRIFLNSEPPYGYTPTCTSKNLTEIPIIPIEPEN